MSKAFFRFLRGELNGFYLQNINNSMNLLCTENREALIDFDKQQFNVNDMSEDTIYNIGKFAGVYPLWLLTSEFYGVTILTESHKVYNKERSERGLFSRETETFNFRHTSQDDYDTDINILATSDDKSSLTTDGMTPLGYISEDDEDMLDENGNVILSKLSSNPPANGAYTNFYGNQFLVLEDENIQLKFTISLEMFYNLYVSMQKIRYNGASIETLCEVIKVICPDNFVQISSITKHPTAPTFVIRYNVDYNSDLTQKTTRLGILEHLVLTKFPQFTLEETVTR